MLTHDELIYCITQAYPEAVHGTNFWVMHMLDEKTGKQKTDAEIVEWHLSKPAPTAREIQALLEKHGAAARTYAADIKARVEREQRLRVADTLVYKAMDTGDMERMRLAGQYRQALRDVTTLPGFPDAFEWPQVPAGLVDLLPANV
jgi:hypothetical protein